MLLKFPINKIVIVGTRYDEDVEGSDMTDSERFDREVTIGELETLYGEGFTVLGNSGGSTAVKLENGTLVSVSDALKAVEALRAGNAK